MAGTITSNRLLLIFVFALVFCITSDANQVVRNGDSKQLSLRKLGYQRYSFDMHPVRLVPGGPDCQHNPNLVKPNDCPRGEHNSLNPRMVAQHRPVQPPTLQ
ncbi:hypothetical protein Tco_0695562 [Tanacetum coccineum]